MFFHNAQTTTPKKLDHFEGIFPIDSFERFHVNQALVPKPKNLYQISFLRNLFEKDLGLNMFLVLINMTTFRF